MLRNLCFLILLLFAIPQPAHAANEGFKLTKEQIDDIGRVVHSNLAGAKISDGTLIGEEKAKTLEYPLVPYDLMEFVIVRGHLAGFAKHCGLDWQSKFFVPLMQGLRAKEKNYNDYQWAFVGMLHGASMGNAGQSMEGKPCDPKTKENLMKAALK